MFVVILFAIIIITIVGSSFYMYFKYLKISDVVARKIEIIGYVFLATVIIWEFVIKNLVMNDFYVVNDYYTVEKIDYIYILLQKICDSLSINDTTSTRFFALEQSDYLSTQLFTTNMIESILQVASTIFIAIGRLQELKNKSIKHTEKCSK